MSRRRTNRWRHDEEDSHDRWLVSYADFVTLLFAFFVVMYAISTVNEGSYRVLTDAIVHAFHGVPRTIQPIKLDPPGHATVYKELSALPMAEDHGPKDEKQTPASLEKLQDLANRKVMEQVAVDVEGSLKSLIEQGDVTVTNNELWVEIDIKSKVLFDSGNAILQAKSARVLQDLAVVLNKYPHSIQVEGFTDNVPISNAVFPSNWELSAARAASVVHLFTKSGIDPQRMAAIGFGEHRAIADNSTAEGRAKNRRVAIVILADKSARHIIDLDRGNGAGTAGKDSGPGTRP